ncbi:HD family phosphohydrolase [Leptolyngbya sp. 7M]|uniref:HD family phosphohydrolase n=1 Tax=Leptolyngbya sp. 7M TaxID=2812896 RepID=UPI001B8AA535|nr:HDIG domain-containing metalloprotein [Leptolyngbya sp. 7M]QYO66352.1 HDIG domain-containing protein [Leptolyngbya sp. 7M]
MKGKLQNVRSPLAKRLSEIGEMVMRPIKALSSNQRFWLGFAVLCVVTTLLIHNPWWRAGDPGYRVDDIARETIVAPADINYVDEEATEREREALRESVIPVFAIEQGRAEEAVQNFRSAWELLQRSQENGSSANRANSNAGSSNKWPGAGGEDIGNIFAARKFSTNELDAVTRVLRESASGDIYGDQDAVYLQSEIEVIDRRRPTDSRRVQNPAATMTSVTEARERLVSGLSQIRSLSPKEVDAFKAAMSPLIQPSIIYDASATGMARNNAAKNVPPVTVSLKRGETVVSAGYRITPEIMSKLTAIRNYTSETRQLNRFIGLLMLISSLFWAAWKYIEHRGIVPRLALSEQKTFALFGFIVLVQAMLLAVFFRLAEFTASQNIRPPLNDPTLWSFAVPFAFGSLLMTLLADRRTALFTGLFIALLAGFMAPKGLEFAVYTAIASSVAVYGIGRYRNRQTITIAGALIGLTCAMAAIALIAYTQQPFILNTIMLAVACGLASGIITAAFTAVFMPICESMFGILTDVKLLELSNADLPVLGQLAMRAPGTNQHSHAVGQLAEEACRVVGGNALLARIGALYHDIGKSAAPEHFVENQLGKNPHDKLKPVQSAKIIISHVTYGMKLAREMGLPQRIIDFIPQHHGTRTLHYFLKKAQAEARDADEISENDFRYPGPKPQFREAAIMMIADSCEAAARSLAEPTPENIRFIVTKIIDAIVSDDQLDECDLTLRELTQIREAMIRSLVAIYHTRVDYPGYNPPTTGSFRVSDIEIDSEERGMKYKNPADVPVSPGGEIEDEAFEQKIRAKQQTAVSGD